MYLCKIELKKMEHAFNNFFGKLYATKKGVVILVGNGSGHICFFKKIYITYTKVIGTYLTFSDIKNRLNLIGKEISSRKIIIQNK